MIQDISPELIIKNSHKLKNTERELPVVTRLRNFDDDKRPLEDSLTAKKCVVVATLNGKVGRLHHILSSEETDRAGEAVQYVDNVLKYVSALAEKDNCKVMITEFDVLHRFFMAEPGVVVDRLEDGSWSKEEFAKAYEIVLEKGKGKVVGFIAGNFLEIEMSGVLININDTPKTKEVVKKWFTEIL